MQNTMNQARSKSYLSIVSRPYQSQSKSHSKPRGVNSGKGKVAQRKTGEGNAKHDEPSPIQIVSKHRIYRERRIDLDCCSTDFRPSQHGLNSALFIKSSHFYGRFHFLRTYPTTDSFKPLPNIYCMQYVFY